MAVIVNSESEIRISVEKNEYWFRIDFYQSHNREGEAVMEHCAVIWNKEEWESIKKLVDEEIEKKGY